MNQHSPADLTRLLQAAGAGEAEASGAVLALVYDTLRGLARRQLAREGPGQTLEPTALVHDAWIRLMGKQGTAWEHRAHFFGAAAQAMRRILVERARKAKRARHGGGRRRVSLDEAPAPLDEQCSEVLALEDLLAELETLDRRKHDVVMLRHYAGLTIEETARALEVSVATVKADWTFARSWLKARLKESAGP